jgi:hypothetical protein
MLKLDGRRFGWLGREQISAELLEGDVIRLDRSAIFFGGLFQFRLRHSGAQVGDVQVGALRPEKRGRSLERLPPQVRKVLVHRRSFRIWNFVFGELTPTRAAKFLRSAGSDDSLGI